MSRIIRTKFDATIKRRQERIKKKKYPWYYKTLELFGALGMIISSLVYLSNLTTDDGIWVFIFNIGLMSMVLDLGIKWLFDKNGFIGNANNE